MSEHKIPSVANGFVAVGLLAFVASPIAYYDSDLQGKLSNVQTLTNIMGSTMTVGFVGHPLTPFNLMADKGSPNFKTIF